MLGCEDLLLKVGTEGGPPGSKLIGSESAWGALGVGVRLGEGHGP